MRKSANYGIGIAFLVGFIIAISVLALGHVPLTLDEVWNYNFLASQGFKFPIFHYPLPNNHVFFTALQGAFLNRDWVFADPRHLRVLNLIYGLILAMGIALLIRKLAAIPFWLSALLSILCLLASPMAVLYLNVARGYLLGTVLVMLAAYLISLESWVRWFAVIAMSLATWTVPTFAYTAPGAVVFLVLYPAGIRPWSEGLLKRFGEAAAFSVAFLIVCGLLYHPIAREVFGNRFSFSAPDFWPFFWDWLAGATQFSLQTGEVVIGVLLIRLALKLGGLGQNANSPSNRLIGSLLLICASFLAVAFLSCALKKANAPFARNAVFIPIYLWTCIVICELNGSRIWGKLALTSLLGISAVLSVVRVTHAFFGPNPNSYPGLEPLTPAPFISKSELSRFGEIQSLTQPKTLDPLFKEMWEKAYGLPVLNANAPLPQSCFVGHTHSPQEIEVTIASVPQVICL